MTCSIEVEDVFGPTVSARCLRGFDFTLLFEENILTIPVSGITAALIIVKLFASRRATHKANGHWMLLAKVLAWAALLGMHIALLLIWATSKAPRTRSTLQAESVTVGCCLFALFLTVREHRNSRRPAKLLQAYLLLSALLDMPRARTLWFVERGSYAVSVIFTTSVVWKVPLLVLESTTKSSSFTPGYTDTARETAGGLFSDLFFLWINRQLWTGYRKILDLADLMQIDQSLFATQLRGGGVERRWQALVSAGVGKKALLRACIKHYKWALAAGIIPRGLQLGFVLAQPFLIQRTIAFVAQPVTPESTNAGYGLIGAYAVVYFGIAVFTAVAKHQTYRLITMLRGSLISMIYAKTMTLPSTSSGDSAPVTLMSADIERISSGLKSIHDLWANLCQIVIALWLLWQQLGVAALGPIIVAVAIIISAVALSTVAAGRQKFWLESIENRVNATSKMLGSMKGVKLLGMRDKAFEDLQGLRKEEIKKSEKYRELLIAAAVLGYSNGALAPVISFTIYSVRARMNGAPPLNTSQGLTSLALCALITTPMTVLVEALAGLGSAVGSINRINDFLLLESRKDGRDVPGVATSNDESGHVALEEKNTLITEYEKRSQDSSLGSETPDHHGSIVSKRQVAGWGNGSKPVLQDLTFELKPSTLTIIIGPVGCGKSTLLYSLLGETVDHDGYLTLSTSTVAFCAQTPWLTNKTVRENILGELPFDEELYHTTIQACALQTDLEILPLGDRSLLGSGGAALSGGQKQRISLARAIYSRKSTVVLDDVLSGLDTTTENQVVRSVFGPGGIFRRRKTTVVLATNSVHQIPLADHILVLGTEGKIIQQGTFADLNASPGFIQSLLVEEKTEDRGDRPADGKAPAEKSTSALPADLSNELPTKAGSDSAVYQYYVQAIGYARFAIFIVLLSITAFFSAFPAIWIERWTKHNATYGGGELGKYLGVYFVLGVGSGLGILFGVWHLMVNMVSKLARVLHTRLLQTVLNAPMSFFTTTDLGVTTNRFTQDLQLIDMELPIALLNTCLSLLLCVAQLVIVAVTTKYLSATIPFCFVAFFLIQRFYLRSARQVRIIDIEAKSPLFTHFMESLSGLVSIRAYGWEKAYLQHGTRLLHDSQKPFYLLYSIQRWLEVVIGLTVAGLAILLVSVAVVTRGKIEVGFVGAALVQIVSFSENIQGLIIAWTILETAVGAVARIKIFTSETSNENLPAEDNDPPPDWPSTGAIEIGNISASYRKELGPVLKNISISITPGEKVAIVGRTGSGKSSLVSTIFRTLDLDSGSILVDGVDLSTLKRQEIRSKMIVIPQEPYFIRGSVRFNLDPDKTRSDNVLIDVLKKVQLWHTIHRQGGLDANVTQELLSHGQRQLLCLASVLLRTGQILVLDEATSSVDQQTDELMQTVIRAEFAKHTIIAIAHRLETILDFDRVIVMDAGVIAEMGSPQQLSQAPRPGDSPSRFRKLLQESSQKSKAETQKERKSSVTERLLEQQALMAEPTRGDSGMDINVAHGVSADADSLGLQMPKPVYMFRATDMSTVPDPTSLVPLSTGERDAYPLVPQTLTDIFNVTLGQLNTDSTSKTDQDSVLARDSASVRRYHPSSSGSSYVGLIRDPEDAPVRQSVDDRSLNSAQDVHLTDVDGNSTGKGKLRAKNA